MGEQRLRKLQEVCDSENWMVAETGKCALIYKYFYNNWLHMLHMWKDNFRCSCGANFNNL